MSSNDTHAIVGAGHAGGRAAQAMRQFGFEGKIILLGEEAYVPYERPPLSKDLMTGDGGIEKAQLHAPGWYAENGIDLRLESPVTALDVGGKAVATESGETIGYDRLMLTTGARVRRLPVPGTDLDGVFYLRDFGDTQAIRQRLKPGVKVVVIGGGFIGLETAASARKRGCDVVVLEAADRLMGRSIAPEVSAAFLELHRGHGVDVRLGAGVSAIEGSDAVTGVATIEASVPADVVVIGIGIAPNDRLAAEAGIEVDNGIVVDDRGRTSDPEVYAAGDVTNQPNAFAGRRLRLESYQNAQDQAMAAARNMCGADEVYEDTLWVWSDQHDVNLQMTGCPESWDELVWRGDVESGAFTVFYLADGRIVAVNTINNGRDMRAAQRLMHSGKSFDPADLADPNIRLLKLAKD